MKPGRHTSSMTYRFLYRCLCVAVIAWGCCLSSARADENSLPARIFYNGKVFTAEPEHPYAEAVAIQGGKIVAVGTLLEVAKSVPAGTERIDLQGKALFP